MHRHRLCLIILTTFYHMCHLLYSATGDVVKVVYYYVHLNYNNYYVAIDVLTQCTLLTLHDTGSTCEHFSTVL